MRLTKSEQINAFSDYLGSRRKAILTAWRIASEADPEQTTAHALSRGQFLDHVPQVLDAFELKLHSNPGGAQAQAAESEKKQEEVKHGLNRWQQGYRLHELMREWGHLQLCLFEELKNFTLSHPEFESETLLEVNRQVILLVNEAISESAAQFERMQQAEAAGRMGDLEGALAQLSEIERRRATLIHEAVHDLRNNLVGASIAANYMGGKARPEADREEARNVLNQALEGVTSMLNELMELARLEAGKEQREIAPFDAAVLINDLAEINRPMAENRGLYLNASGQTALLVEGDSGKVRRLLQNLLINALKYTQEGGVTLSWGEEKVNWWVMVRDTGPGLPQAVKPLAKGLMEATASAREADEKAAATKGEPSQVLAPAPGAAEDPFTIKENPGEGIGLSIVKRICELLDGSLEMTTSAKTGTTFRVVFPKQYSVR